MRRGLFYGVFPHVFACEPVLNLEGLSAINLINDARHSTPTREVLHTSTVARITFKPLAGTENDNYMPLQIGRCHMTA